MKSSVRPAHSAALALLILAVAGTCQPSAATGSLLNKLPFTGPAAGVEHGTRFGLGTVVSREGHILTSLHVVRGCSVVRFARKDGPHDLASVIGTDSNNDLALLKTTRRDLPVALIRMSPPAKEGEFVRFTATKGNSADIPDPFPVSRALTVSRMGAEGDVRLFAMSGSIIGEAAEVERGDSGGPVFDRSGAVVGIVTGTLPYSSETRLRHLKGLGYATHAAIGVLFLTAHNVPVRTYGEMAPVGGGDPSTPAALSRIATSAGGDDPVAAGAEQVTVRIWCTPGPAR